MTDTHKQQHDLNKKDDLPKKTPGDARVLGVLDDFQNTAHKDTGEKPPQKPDWLPDKFWKDGEAQVENLAKSYRALEQKLSQSLRADTPPSVDADTPYNIDLQGISIDRDTAFENHLKQAGLTDAQAQAIYVLADKYLGEFFQQKQNMHAQLMEMELAQHFGSVEDWQTLQPVLYQWAQDNLPEETVVHLATSVQGVKALHKMMTAHGEPKLSDNGHAGIPITQESLQKMMDNPKYWRERDPAYIDKVQQGFKTLYG